MKVLITGGAGFIGANLCRLLLEKGHEITVLDNLSTGRKSYLDGLPLTFVEGDIRDREKLARVVPGHQGIVHLAAQVGVPASLADPHYDCELNVIGTLNMLEASRLAGIERFVFASSNATLGKQPPPATEDKAPLPISPYGASKLAGEGYCLAYHGSFNLGTVVLRFANLYGPFLVHTGSVVAKFFHDIQTKGQIQIDGDGQQTRDFIFVTDLCEVIHLALSSQVAGEIFQIATGKETSILELAGLVQKVTGTTFEIIHGARRQGDIRKNYSTIDKVGALLHWQPQIALDEGLVRTWQWLQARPKVNLDC